MAETTTAKLFLVKPSWHTLFRLISAVAVLVSFPHILKRSELTGTKSFGQAAIVIETCQHRLPVRLLVQDTRAERVAHVFAAPAAEGAHGVSVLALDAVVQGPSHAYKCLGGLDIGQL